MRTLVKIWALGLLGIILVIAVGCAAVTPKVVEVDPNLAAERDIARYHALDTESRVEEIRALAELEGVRGDTHIRKLEAETSATILKMHEMVDADYRRLIDHQNAFVDAVNNHQSALMNQTYVIEQQYDMWSRIDHNSRAAADNSWFSNVCLILLAFVVLGLIGLVVMLAARFERKLAEVGGGSSKEEVQEDG